MPFFRTSTPAPTPIAAPIAGPPPPAGTGVGGMKGVALRNAFAAFQAQSPTTVTPPTRPPITVGRPTPISPTPSLPTGAGVGGMRGVRLRAAFAAAQQQAPGAILAGGSGFTGKGGTSGATPGIQVGGQTPIQGGMQGVKARFLAKQQAAQRPAPGSVLPDGRVVNADGSVSARAAGPERTVREAVTGRRAKLLQGGRDISAIQARGAVTAAGRPALAAIGAPTPPPAIGTPGGGTVAGIPGLGLTPGHQTPGDLNVDPGSPNQPPNPAHQTPGDLSVDDM